MGCHSWLKADDLTEIANITYGMPFKFLIPQEYGGGFIIDQYRDYGRLVGGYDMFEILAFWNKEQLSQLGVTEKLCYDGEFPFMKKMDRYTNSNREIGIQIGVSDDDVDKLKFPLRLVSISYDGKYEDLKKPSYRDPNQGCDTLYRKRRK